MYEEKEDEGESGNDSRADETRRTIINSLTFSRIAGKERRPVRSLMIILGNEQMKSSE